MSYTSLVGFATHDTLRGLVVQNGDGIVTAASQQLSTVVSGVVSGIYHVGFPITISLGFGGLLSCGSLPLAEVALLEVHTCETSDLDVQTQILHAINKLPPTVALSLNQTTFTNGAVTLRGTLSWNTVPGGHTGDLYVRVRVPTPFGPTTQLVGAVLHASLPPLAGNHLLLNGTLTGVPAGSYTLFVVLVKPGGDPAKPADQLSNEAEARFTVR